MIPTASLVAFDVFAVLFALAFLSGVVILIKTALDQKRGLNDRPELALPAYVCYGGGR